MQEQIAFVKASVERQSASENETDQCPTNAGMQKRKLYFSAGNYIPPFHDMFLNAQFKIKI